VVARASHLLARGRRCGVATARASHLLMQGRRNGVAQGRSEPPVVVSGLPPHELRMLANYGWPNIEKIATCIRSNYNIFSNTSK
jgi:hypothetical protein